jgi:hypothetical protein
MSLATKLKTGNVKLPSDRRKMGPLWKGPEKDGITFSLLSRYLSCKERFRLMVIEGLAPIQGFNHYIEYGQMWHACEEALAAEQPWLVALEKYCLMLYNTYPLQRQQVDKWFMACRTQFPYYVEYWRRNDDVKNRKPLMQEQTFKVDYKLPSGRTVIIRGKWDSVDLVKALVWLQENKTKSEIDETQLKRQLTFDLQTMIYVTALKTEHPEYNIAGVRYNVIKRPFSGGKGSIKQLGPSKKNPKGESTEDFYRRLGEYFRTEPKTFFARFQVNLTKLDIARFEKQCLVPLLENVCDDYEWWADCFAHGKANGYDIYDHHVRAESFGHFPRHYRHPFGVRNILDEGGATDLDEYLISGSEVGLTRLDRLFRELEG